MKNLVVILLAFFPLFIVAQTEGIIQFKETVSLQIDLPEGMEEFAAQIPSSQSSNMTLIFNSKETLYESAKNNKETEDLNMGSKDSGMQIKMNFEKPDNKTFTNIENGVVIKKEDFMGKKFLIEGEVKKYKWKLTSEQDTILNHICTKATFQDSTNNYIAWFTPQIPIAAGPGSISGLPGMILKLNKNDGQILIEATSIELKKLDKDAIKIPKKGKKVTMEEYKEIQNEKIKELEKEFGGSGSGNGTRIIIRN